jgi:hypothetical protein
MQLQCACTPVKFPQHFTITTSMLDQSQSRVTISISCLLTEVRVIEDPPDQIRSVPSRVGERRVAEGSGVGGGGRSDAATWKKRGRGLHFLYTTHTSYVHQEICICTHYLVLCSLNLHLFA